MLDVTGVEYCEDDRPLLTFEDGTRREINVADLVQFHGVFSPLADPVYFRRVSVNPDVGTIVWPNGADLCPDVLYERSRPIRTPGTKTKKPDASKT